MTKAAQIHSSSQPQAPAVRLSRTLTCHPTQCKRGLAICPAIKSGLWEIGLALWVTEGEKAALIGKKQQRSRALIAIERGGRAMLGINRAHRMAMYRYPHLLPLHRKFLTLPWIGLVNPGQPPCMRTYVVYFTLLTLFTLFAGTLF